MSATTPTPAALQAVVSAAAAPDALTMPTIRATMAAAGFAAPRRLRRAALLGALADAATTAAAALPPAAPDAPPAAPDGETAAPDADGETAPGPVLLTPDTAGDAVPLADTPADVSRVAGRPAVKHADRAALLVSLGCAPRGYLTHRADGKPETGAIAGAAGAVALAMLRAAVVVAVDARPQDNRPDLPGPAAAVLAIDGEPVPVTAPAAIVPAAALRPALAAAIDLRPWAWAPRKRGGHTRKALRPLAGYVVTPATKTRPASFRVVKGYPVADVLAAINGLRPGHDTAPAGSGAWCAVVAETAREGGIDDLHDLTRTIGTTAAVLAAVAGSPDLGTLADLYREHLEALAAGVKGRRDNGRAAGVAGRVVKGHARRRDGYRDTAGTVTRRRAGGWVVRNRRSLSRKGRKGGKGGKR